MTALCIITVQKSGGFSAEHSRQFPAKVIYVLNATVAAPRTKGAHDMGAVAHENYAVMHEPVEFGATKFVNAHPVEPEIHLAYDRLDARKHLFFAGLKFGVCIWAQL